MMRGLCNNSLTTIVTVCRRDVERSGALAISMRKSFTCNLLTSSEVSTVQYHYRAAVCRQARPGFPRAVHLVSDSRLAHLQPVVLGATLRRKPWLEESITTSFSEHLPHAAMWMLAQRRTGAILLPSLLWRAILRTIQAMHFEY
jgi:hypothetical protein